MRGSCGLPRRTALCYRNRRRMYLWKYHASGPWLAAHEMELEQNWPGLVAVIDRPGRSRFLVQVTCRRAAEVARLVRRFGGIAESLGKNWPDRYLAPARPPLRIGRRLIVVTEPPTAGATPQLVIPAAGAFGTGEHATTAMTLRLLEEVTRPLSPGWRSLDAGTGTGILALAARRFGAQEVLGLDNDPRAVSHAKSNARLNEITRAKFITADVLRWKPNDPFEIITANLFSELLIAALPNFRRALPPDGVLIASGILRVQAAEVIRALRDHSFRLEIARRRGKWVALLARGPAFRKRS